MDIHTRIDTFGFTFLFRCRRWTYSTMDTMVSTIGSYATVIQIQWRTTCYLQYISKVQQLSSKQTHYFVQRPMFYIGSTKVGVCHREYNRHTQLNRYKHGKAIQVELAIRWWASENNYSQFSTIAVKHFDTYEAAWTYEHALIEQLQAPLNHPLISKHLTRNAFRYFYKPEKRRLAGIESRYRLFRRIRRRTTTSERIIMVPLLH